MEIYIGNIPKGTRPTELKKLLKDSVKASVFSRMYEQAVALGRFDNDIEINIVKRKRFKKHGYYRYGHLIINSDRIAPVALEALQDSKIRGSKLEVREFVQRNSDNDRRASDWESKPWNRRQRRKTDRREIAS
ncbi:hypothetical protein [Kaarinaea lacus]